MFRKGKRERPEAKLTIELVPKTSFWQNVRNEVPKKIWDKVRKFVYKRANYKCEICNGKGKTHPVECHEIWEYDDASRIQTLIDFISLCPKCHQVKHLGLSEIRGFGVEAEEHLQKINGWNKVETDIYITLEFDLWRERSEYEWRTNTDYLREFLDKIN